MTTRRNRQKIEIKTEGVAEEEFALRDRKEAGFEIEETEPDISVDVKKPELPEIEAPEKPPKVITRKQLTENLDQLSRAFNIPRNRFVTEQMLADLSKPPEQRSRKYNIPYEQYLTTEQARYLGLDVPDGYIVMVSPLTAGEPTYTLMGYDESRISSELKHLDDVYYPDYSQTSFALNDIYERLETDYGGFVGELYDRMGEEGTIEFLRLLGVAEDYVIGAVSIEKQEEMIDESIKKVLPDYDAERLYNLMAEDFTRFIFEIQKDKNGKTRDKRRLLEIIGFEPAEVNEILRYRRDVVVWVDGNADVVDIDLDTKNAYDKDGNYTGTYNYVTREFTKAPPKSIGQNIVDTLHFSSRQYWENFENFITGVLPEIIYTDIPEGYLGSVGDFMRETNAQQRENWRYSYRKNREEYQKWMGDNPELAPPRNYQEGAFKNPELWSDPNYWLYEITNMLPLVVTGIVTTLATGGTGLPYFVISTAGMGAIEGGALYDEMLLTGADPQQASDIALLAGAVIGSLESVGRIPVLKQLNAGLFGQFKKKATNELGKRLVLEAKKRFGRNFTQAQLSEILTEVAQEVIGNIAVGFFDENRSAFENLPDIAVKTAIASVPFSLIGAGTESMRMVSQSELKGLNDTAKKAKGWLTDGKGNWFELEPMPALIPEMGFPEGEISPVGEEMQSILETASKYSSVKEFVNKNPQLNNEPLYSKIRDFAFRNRGKSPEEIQANLIKEFGEDPSIILYRGISPSLRLTPKDTELLGTGKVGKFWSPNPAHSALFVRGKGELYAVEVKASDLLDRNLAEIAQGEVRLGSKLQEKAVKIKTPRLAEQPTEAPVESFPQPVEGEITPEQGMADVESALDAEGLTIDDVINNQHPFNFEARKRGYTLAKRTERSTGKVRIRLENKITGDTKTFDTLAEASEYLSNQPLFSEIQKPQELAENIRLEKYSEDVRPLITEWAETNMDKVAEARRGVISDEQVRSQAEQLVLEVGGDLDKARSKWRAGQAWSAEQTLALRGVLQQKSREVISAQKLARENNSTENLLKLQVALQEQAAVQEIIHGITAEAGRTLRSFRQNVFDAIDSSDTERMEDILSKIGGRENLEKIAQQLAQIDINDPVAVNRFIQSLYQPKLMDYLIEIFYNSILSGPKTHIVNSMSNLANMFFSPVERGVSALVDLPLSFIQQRERTRFLSEVPADIIGAFRGIPEGFRQFAYVIKNGISFDEATKWEFRQKAFRGKPGAIINMPSRFLEGADMLMKAINFRAALNAEACRIAKMEKKKGWEFEARVAELLSNPTADMMKKATDTAEYRLFRKKPGKFGQSLMNQRDAVTFLGIKPLRFVIPFVRTPVNLVKFGLERTPLGWLNFTEGGLWKNLKRGEPEASDQIARAFIGTMGFAALMAFFSQGMITGAPPRDRAERDRFYREGKQPYAIRVDGFWVSYQRLEPFNQLLSQVAILSESLEADDEKTFSDKLWDAVNTFGQNFVSQTYMSSVSDLIDMLSEPERYAGKWFNRFAASMVVPMSSATRTTAQMMDDVIRDPENAWKTIEASIPGLSNKVKAKLDVLGRDIQRKSPAWFPVSVTPVEETILSQEIERLKYDIGFVGATIAGIKLTEEEQYDYQKIAGTYTKEDLERLMLAPDYWKATDEERKDMIANVIRRARERARSEIKSRLYLPSRVEDLSESLAESLKSADSRLGEIMSAVPEYSHEPEDIYDTNELDKTYRLILTDVPEKTIKDPPATVKSWYAKEGYKEESAYLPNGLLVNINADPSEGDTYEDYYRQWQERSSLTDIRDIEEFDKKYPDAKKGNFSKRQLELLRELSKLKGKDRSDFIAMHYEELNQNPYKDWLVNNPDKNAELALWGDAKLLTKESYDSFINLAKRLDIPELALPDVVPDNLEAFELSASKRFMDIERQIEMAKALDNEVKGDDGLTERERKVQELKSMKVTDGLTYADALRKIEAINQGTDEKPVDDVFIDAWVDRGRVIDEYGAGSSEAHQWLIDNKDVWDWALDNELLTDDGADWNKEVIKINVDYRDMDDKYKGYGEESSEYFIEDDVARQRARDRLLEQNEDYRKARRRREALQLSNKLTGQTFPTEQLDSYIYYYELPETGYRRARFLLNNPKFAQAMHDIKGVDLPEAKDVPSLEYDNITEEWQDDFDKWNGLNNVESRYYEGNADRRKAEYDNMKYTKQDKEFSGVRFKGHSKLTGFGIAYITRQAHYDLRALQGDPNYNNYVRQYVEYYTLISEGKPEDWEEQMGTSEYYEDDWFLMESRDFYIDVYRGVIGNKQRDFRKVPSREVYELYLVYLRKDKGSSRDEYRFLLFASGNNKLEEWLVETKGYRHINEKRISEGDKSKLGLKEREKSIREQIGELERILAR